MITLTSEERDKFSRWLEQEASGVDPLMEKLEQISPPLARIKRAESAMLRAVAKIVMNTETQEIP